MSVRLTTVHGTAADPSTGLTLLRDYLVEKYLQSPEYGTVLANSKYGSEKNLPRMSGQSALFTIREPTRIPERGKEGQDPESGFKLSYRQVEVPIEWIKEYTDYSIEARETSWIDLARDIDIEMRVALRRAMHYDIQHAFWVGRYLPGRRNANGVTDGSANYPHFYTTPEPTVSLYGKTFTFPRAPRYFAAGRSSFAQLQPNDFATMSLFQHVRTRILNSRAPRINGGLVCVISEAVKEDLLRDSEFREAVIRNQGASDKMFEGELVSFDGIHWVIDDEPMTLKLGTSGDARAGEFEGEVHVCQMFGMDAFGYLRLGGKNAAAPNISVKDLSKTGSVITVGYTVPWQCMILRPEWCAAIAVVVRNPERNA